MVLTFEWVHEFLKCDILNESYWRVTISCGTVYFSESVYEIPMCDDSDESYLVQFILLCKMVPLLTLCMKS